MPTGSKFPKMEEAYIQPRANSAYYGSGWTNINTSKGWELHDAGYFGQGMTIGVIDSGYGRLLTHSMFDNMNLKGYKSFIHKVNDINGNDHGIWVASNMAANKPNVFVGTAPQADYWLFRTEDENSEYPVEEDYWVNAIEYADSVGVDIVNSSLGYAYFDAPAINYTYDDTDGNTAYISQAATMAAEKGIFVVVSAGNSGSWVEPPGDSPLVLTVGAIDSNSFITSFSSYGRTVDGRTKPDVVALGRSAAVIGNGAGNGIGSANGTSFSSPITCGLVACLWGAYPTLTNMELRQVIIESSANYPTPIIRYGYGKPDWVQALILAKQIADSK